MWSEINQIFTKEIWWKCQNTFNKTITCEWWIQKWNQVQSIPGNRPSTKYLEIQKIVSYKHVICLVSQKFCWNRPEIGKNRKLPWIITYPPISSKSDNPGMRVLSQICTPSYY